MSEHFNVGAIVASIQVDVSSMRTNLANAAESFGKVGESMDKVKDSLGRLDKSMDKLSSGFNSVKSAILSSTRTIQDALEAIPDSFDKMARQSNKSMQLIKESMDATRKSSLTLNSTFKTGMSELSNNVHRNTEIIHRDLQLLRTELNKKHTMKFDVSGAAMMEKAMRNALTNLRLIVREEDRVAQGFRGISSSMSNAKSVGDNFTSGLLGKLREITTNIFFVQMSFEQLKGIMMGVFGQGIGFAVELENSLNAMAAIFQSSMKKISTGDDLTWGESMGLAAGAVDRLRIAALTTNSTLEELMGTFQAIIGPATSMKMSFDEALNFTVFGSTAVKAMGLRKDQLIQELRSILTGNITTRSSTVATALGLTNEDIENAKNSAEGLYSFLEKRMKGYVAAAEVSKQTFMTMWTNITDGIQQTQEKAFQGLFIQLKGYLKKAQDLFTTPVPAKAGGSSDKGGGGGGADSQLNPEVVSRFERLAQITQKVLDDFTGWLTVLSNTTSVIETIESYSSALSMLISASYKNIKYIAQDLLVIFAVSGGWLRLATSLAMYLGVLPDILKIIADNITTVVGVFTVWYIAWGLLTSKAVLTLASIALGFTNVNVLIRTATGSLTTFGLIVTGLPALWGGVVAAIRSVIVGVVTLTASVRTLGITATLASLAPPFLAAVVAVTAVAAAVYAVGKALDWLMGKADAAKSKYAYADDPKNRFADIKDSALRAEMEGRYALAESRQRSPENMAREQEFYLKSQSEGISASDITNKFETEDKKAGKDAEKARKDALRARIEELDYEAKIFKEKKQEELDDAQYVYKELNGSAYDYYQTANRIAVEIANKDRETLLAKADLAETERERTKYSEEANLRTQKLERERALLLRNQKRDEVDYHQKILSLEAERLNASGQFAKAATQEWDVKHYDELERLENEIDARKRIIALDESAGKDTSAQREKLALYERIHDSLFQQRATLESVGLVEEANFRFAEEELEYKREMNTIEAEHRQGKLTELQYQQRIIDLNNKHSANMKTTYDEINKIILNNPLIDPVKRQALLDALEQMRGKVEELKEPLTAMQKQVKNIMVDEFTDAFTAWVKGTKSMSEAFSDCISSILADIARLRIQAAMESAMNDIFGSAGGSGGGGIFGWLGGLLGFSDGGLVQGKGTSTSDDIPVRLSHGEYVVRAESVRKIGLSNLERINAYGMLPTLKYASGGAVGGGVTSNTEGGGIRLGAGGISTIKVEIINESGHELQVADSKTSINAEEFIMSFWIKGVKNNTMGSRDLLSSMSAGGKR